MGDHLVKAMLFDNILINGVGSATSEVFPMRGVERAESLLITASSVLGTADIKIEHAISVDGVIFGSFDDYTDIVASSLTEFVTDEGLTAVPLPNFLAPYVKFKVTGVAANATDTRVTIRLLLREGF